MSVEKVQGPLGLLGNRKTEVESILRHRGRAWCKISCDMMMSPLPMSSHFCKHAVVMIDYIR